MSRILFLGITAYLLFLAGMGTVHGEMFALMLPLVVYLLAGYLFAPDEIQLEATRHLSAERVSPGSEIHISVTITNRGSQMEEVLIEDVLPTDLRIASGHTRHLIQ